LLLFMAVLVAAAVPLSACPMFVEFFPDPTEVGDNEGEFVEIRLDDFRADSLYVSFDQKAPLAFPFPRSANRMVLVHDSTLCPKRDSLACGKLGYALPNSRESVWVLQSGTCKDSVLLATPKPGKALQRVGETDEWAFSAGTFGVADPDYELGIRDCALSLDALQWRDGAGWMVRGYLGGCDSSLAVLEFLDLMAAGGWKRESVSLAGAFKIEVASKSSAWFRLVLPGDAAPSNDSLDRFLIAEGRSPVAITEVHHCPAEPEPEWVEVYNRSRYALPLSRLRFCGRGGLWGRPADSLRPYESLLLTKDSADLREALGFKDVKIVQVPMGFLNNVSGSISICLDSVAVDSAAWNKNTVACPSGFSPLYGRAEYTPGFQRVNANSVLEEPFTYKLSSRVVRRRAALRVSVVSDSELHLRLLDSAGHGVWNARIPPQSTSWYAVPAGDYCGVGVCYVSMSVGTFEKVVGIVVRP